MLSYNIQGLASRSHRAGPANVDFAVYGSRILRRLDRIYAPPPLSPVYSDLSFSILLGLALSDHAPPRS